VDVIGKVKGKKSFARSRGKKKGGNIGWKQKGQKTNHKATGRGGKRGPEYGRASKWVDS